MTKRRMKKRSARRAAAPAFRLLKQRYELLMGAINEGVYDWNVVDDTIHYSANVQKAVGLPPELLKTAADWRNRIHPEDLPRYDRAFVELFKGKASRFECDYRYRALDDSWRWARQHGVALRGPGGRVRRVVGATGDITELKRTEQALTQSEERYALATSAAVEGIYEWDVETGTLFLTDRAKSFFALSGEQLTPAAWNERIHGDDFAAYRGAIVEHFKGRAPNIEHEYRIADGEGGYRWIRERGIGVRNSRGRVVKVFGALMDITRRKRAELEQSAITEVLRVMSESRMDASLVFDAIMRHASRLCEASFAAVFAYDGEFLRNVAHQNASPAFAETLRRTRARPSRETTTRLCALERRTVHTPDLLNDPAFSPPEPQRHEKVGTSLSVPMMREGELLGVITLWRNEVRPFSESQIALVQTFADQAVIAVENVRLFNETKEALERQTAAADILRVISASPTNVQPVLDALAASAHELCTADVVIVLREGDEMRFGAHAGPLPINTSMRRPLGRTSVQGRSIVDAATVHVLRSELVEKQLPLAAELAERHGLGAMLGVPMLRNDVAIGSINLRKAEEEPFTPRQIELLETFAAQAVIAIENVRLFGETREALEQQTATAEILKVISRSPGDTQPVFDAIVQSGLKLFADAAISVALPEGERIRAAAVAESDPARAAAWRGRFPFPLTREYMHGAAILDRKVVDLPDVRDAPPHMAAGSRNFLASGYRAITIMPMMHGEQAIGALSVVRLAPGPLSAKQLAVLKTFADQAVIAIENVRLFNETKEALQQQTAISEILRVISGSPTEATPMLDAVAERAVKLCESGEAGIFLQEGDCLRFAAGCQTSVTFQSGETIPITRGSVLGRALLDRQAVHVEDLAAAPVEEYPLAREYQKRFGHRSIVAVPLMREDRAIGVIGLWRFEVRAFSEKHIALVRTFADQAAIAIENVRLFNETREALEQQKAAGEVLRVISSSIADTGPVFDKILESCERLFAGRIVGLNLVHEDGMLHIGAYHGAHREEFERIFPIPVTRESGSGLSIVERRVVHYPDADGADVPARTRQGCRAIGIKSAIFAPLLWEGRGVGAIFVGRDHVSSFSEKEITLLRTFADQAAIAIENVRLFKEIQEKSRQLEAASRHKSEFLANMSHELRTPLNAIIGFTRIVMRRSQEVLEPKQYENLEKILASGQNLLALINAVLDLSKVEAGRVELRPGEVELAPLLDQCLRTIEPLVRVALVKELDGGLPPMFVDEEKLRQIVINLLSNAAKFTERGTIRLRAQAANGSVAITVADTGIGIAADKLGLIFEEFEQVDAGSTRAHGGTGLGLTIARRLARLMGGDIGVESALGTGSRFTLTLPLRYPA